MLANVIHGHCLQRKAQPSALLGCLWKLAQMLVRNLPSARPGPQNICTAPTAGHYFTVDFGLPAKRIGASGYCRANGKPVQVFQPVGFERKRLPRLFKSLANLRQSRVRAIVKPKNSILAYQRNEEVKVMQIDLRCISAECVRRLHFLPILQIDRDRFLSPIAEQNCKKRGLLALCILGYRLSKRIYYRQPASLSHHPERPEWSDWEEHDLGSSFPGAKMAPGRFRERNHRLGLMTELTIRLRLVFHHEMVFSNWDQVALRCGPIELPDGAL